MLFVLSLFASFACSLDIHDWKKQQISPPNISTLFYRYGSFIAKQNDSIYILGGDPSERSLGKFNPEISLVEFNTASHSFTSHSNTHGFGQQQAQSSTQIDDDLFMLPYYSYGLTKLNLNTLSTKDITRFPGGANTGRCMTHFDSYLIVIGGSGSNHIYGIGSMYIYDIINDEWLNGPSFPSPRYDHSCNIISKTIYVFGGWNKQYLNDIWILKIDDINNCCLTEWNQLNTTLSSPRANHRSIAVGTNIYIIGGGHNSLDLSQVYLFNTETKEISFYSNMIYGKATHSAIELNSIIYVFGGVPETNNIYYQYTNLIPTSSPSNSPTTSPTQNPSNPTINPTFSPSSAPTMHPSFALSDNSNSLWIGVGTGIGLLLCIIFICGIVYYGYKWKKEKIQEDLAVELDERERDLF